MQGKPTVYIDIDGTLVNFLARYAEFHTKAIGKHIDWRGIADYDLRKSMPTEVKYQYLYDRSFYEDIKFMRGALEAVSMLYTAGYEIKFITAAVTLESMIGKFKLLQRTFKWFHIEKNWMVMSRKQHVVVPNSVIIDDNPYFFKESKFTYNVCFAWPHNLCVRHLSDLYTNDWNRIYNFVTHVKPKSEPSGWRRLKLWIDSRCTLLNRLTR